MSCKAVSRVPKDKGRCQPRGTGPQQGREAQLCYYAGATARAPRPALLLLSLGDLVAWREKANSRGERPHMRVLAAAAQAFPTHSLFQP